MKKRIKRVLFDLVNGVRSGIPLCCIFYFIKEMQKGKPVALETCKKRGIRLQDSPGNYVLCERCYRKGRIKEINLSNGSIWHGLVD